MLSTSDLTFIEKKGITAEMIDAQLKRFEVGFPFLKINAVATIGNGIKAFSPEETAACVKAWSDFQQTGKAIEKFVPASGAASRMFKNMFAFASSGKDAPTTDFEKEYFENITKFAFYADLNNACRKLYRLNVQELMSAGRYVDVVKAMLEPEGLNYGFLPKALLKFHKTTGGNAHTPLEEHLEEGAQYAADKNRKVNLHFTVSPEHKAEFEKLLASKLPIYEQVWGVKYNVTMSEQKSSTDTIAVNMDNTPYREPNGELLFRPAGHGALIENLNERDAAVVFIKNIDNVVPDRIKDETVLYKKLIAGILVDVQKQVFEYLRVLESGKYSHEKIEEMIRFVQHTLCCRKHDIKELEDADLVIYLKNKLNRPIRVCGVVKNVGEPGGGPFLCYNADGTVSPQILESSQIDTNNAEYVAMFKNGTHFNPVDLVCATKDYKGNRFDLLKHVDHNTGFISSKSKNGKELKALELPGLWNGAMSDWSTIFVEVPVSTFNPVKTVNDLLREQHQ